MSGLDRRRKVLVVMMIADTSVCDLEGLVLSEDVGRPGTDIERRDRVMLWMWFVMGSVMATVVG